MFLENSSFESNDFIESPVLFFLNNKVDAKRSDDILNVASFFLNEGKIKAAMHTLFRVMDYEADRRSW